MTKVLGIDPGYDRVGIAIVTEQNRKDTVLFSDCFETKRNDNFTDRLRAIGEKIEEVIATWKPDVVSIEQLFFQTNRKTAMRVAEARGVLLYIAAKHTIPIIEFGPGQIKSAVTGDGRATKDQVIKMIQLITGVTGKRRDDEYDAIAVALTGVHTNIQNLDY